MRVSKISILTGALLTAGTLFAQEKNLSQYYSNRMMFNPAMTGISEGPAVGVNYRNQYNNLNLPMNTVAASAESQHKGLGFGVLLNSQSSGDGGFKTTNIVASAAYHLNLEPSGDYQLSLGLQGGVTTQALDFSKLTFASQYSSVFGPIFPSGENFSNSRSTALDVNAGLFFSNNGSQQVRPFLGLSVFHINKPEQKLTAIAGQIPRRYQVHGGLNIGLTESVSVTPHAAYFTQAKADQYSTGLMVNIEMDGKVDGVYFGGNYRNDDAVAFMVGTVYNQLAIGFSFDVAAGNTKTASISQQAVEFSLNYRFKKAANKFSFPRF